MSEETDGYWLKMGEGSVEALHDLLRPDLTDRRREIIAECLGGIFDSAYKMGIRLGELQERMKTRQAEEGNQ